MELYDTDAITREILGFLSPRLNETLSRVQFHGLKRNKSVKQWNNKRVAKWNTWTADVALRKVAGWIRLANATV